MQSLQMPTVGPLRVMIRLTSARALPQNAQNGVESSRTLTSRFPIFLVRSLAGGVSHGAPLTANVAPSVMVARPSGVILVTNDGADICCMTNGVATSRAHP